MRGLHLAQHFTMDSTLNVTGLDGKGIQRILDTTARIETPPWYWIALTLVLSGYLLSLASVHVLGPKAPLVGIQSIFEPRIVGNWRFFRNSSKIIDEGYNKVSLTICTDWLISFELRHRFSQNPRHLNSSEMMQIWSYCPLRQWKRSERCRARWPTRLLPTPTTC